VLKNYLLDRHPIAVAIPVYDSWANNPAVTDSGNIGMPLPGETSQYGHALVLVGFADDGTFPGGGYFIIRNSYGTTWGAHCPFGAGYGTIPYRYIELDNYSAFIVRL
jgi:C1A family cysteine protease